MDPLAHAAINVALYGADGRRWAMTERSSRRVEREATTLRIGPSALRWDGTMLELSLDEVTAPWPRRVRGTVRLAPGPMHETFYALDARGHHEWQPIAPCGRVEVALERPASRWSGHAYFDSNRGAVPLEQDFARWHWARARDASGRTSVLYDVVRRDGSELALALGFAPDDAEVTALAPPPPRALTRSGWGIARAMRADEASATTVVRTLEDGPFYARSIVATRLAGSNVTAVHESLDLDRFASPWVQAMLPFRMPRRR